MIAYNKIWLANVRLQDEVEIDIQQGNITPAEFKAIQTKYPVGFYTPNLFVRVGLFILTCVIVSFAGGFITMIAESMNLHVFENFGYFLFLGVLSYIGLELMVKSQNHHRSGVDDALLFISAGQFITGFVFLLARMDGNFNYMALSGIIFLICLCLTIRFNDMLTAAVGCFSFFAFIFFTWIKIVPAGLSTAPFIMMLVSGGMYWMASSYSSRKEFINYDNSLVIAQVVSLLALYTSGNYYIIQTLSTEMMGKTGPVPFGMIFWAWTILMPFFYIIWGIRSKDAILLRTGLVLIAPAVLTFRNYYHILPSDVMFTIAGAIVLAFVYGVMKYLKTPKHGFTYAEPDKVNSLDHLKVESLIVAETFSHAPAAPANDNLKFGGGDFGGGGSSGGF
jgi:hypothetical protein